VNKISIMTVNSNCSFLRRYRILIFCLKYSSESIS